MTRFVSANATSSGRNSARRLVLGWWVGTFVALVLWVAYRLDLFDVWTWVTASDGARTRLPDTYATVDHPFHAARAETLRQSLADGEWLRWIGHHQGGFPVEFYPLGVAWFEVALWAGFLGLLPMAYVHKVAVAVIFLLPMLGYLLLARRDRLSPGIALAASAAHVCVNGWWWSGGFHELVSWGLITNVAGHVLPLFALTGLVSYLHSGSRANGALAITAAAGAIYSNPRSVVPVAVVGIAALITVAADHSSTRPVLGRLLGRLALVGGAAGLLAAPELIALIRFDDLYYFVHYQRYENVSALLDSSIQAVSGPIFVAGVVGLVLGFALPGRVQTRAVAISLLIYASLTAILATRSVFEGTVEQLELTRLMPFQRLLTIYLAAIAVHDALGWAGRRFVQHRHAIVDVGLVAIAGLVVLLYVVTPPTFIPDGDRGLYSIPSAAQPEIAELEEAVRAADREAEAGAAVLVLGTTISWHDQLWAPLWSDRPFFYDDWLWYWQTAHYGDYDPLVEHAYPNDASTLDAEYLRRHGIGAVVVTGAAKADAAASPFLRHRRSGVYDVYVVQQPTTVVTFGDDNAVSSAVMGQRVTATGVGDGGTALVRRNWFPRWQATVNGEPAAITRTDDGYMTVPVPSGDAQVELTYALDGWDWIARGLVVLGLGVVLYLLVPERLTQRISIVRDHPAPA
ncbi:MAG: hypothetical protein ACRDJW_15705 [Thermomicrobiales bacterium]